MFLNGDFYQRSTTQVAKGLLGTFLRCESPAGVTVGRIVETEAYLFRRDPACHAHRGMTKRNAVMFGPPGQAYVYLIYGMYHCFNVVTANEGVGEAVLIRALEPVAGIELMQQRRSNTRNHSPNHSGLRNLCSGPGKLVIAMGIGREHNGQTLLKGGLRIESSDSYSGFEPVRKRDIVVTTRVGISDGAELPLRYYIANNKFISRP